MTPDVEAIIVAVSGTYRLPHDLLQAQVIQESSGDPWAFRYEHGFFTNVVQGNPKALAGAYGPLAACSYGLLQILLETAYEIGYSDRPEGLFVPKVGLAFGAKYMRQLWDRFGGADPTYHTALAAYNAGPRNVKAGLTYADQVFVKAGRPVPVREP